MNISGSTTRLICYPSPIARNGCPTQLTPLCQISTLPEGDRVRLIHNYTTMHLLHHTKTGMVKNSLPLNPIHHELEQAALLLLGSGSSNMILSKVSFDCLITDISGNQSRAYIPFDLKIPGTNTERDSVFSYDMIENLYGGKRNLYEALRFFFNLGRSIANPTNFKHGHVPDYNPDSSNHDQYIRHSEQLLVAYLALPQAADMLATRLRTEIRGKHPKASSVKIYNMGLHMHSTKTCCAPCEYSLLGLMNDRSGQHGFIHNFKQSCDKPNDQLSFTLPKKSPFQLLVTVTATQNDSDHKKQPSYTSFNLATRDQVPPYTIPVKNPAISTRIFTTTLNNAYDIRKLPSSPTLTDKTVGISGSKATPGSSGTINRTKASRDSEIDAVIGPLAFLKI